MKASSIAAIGIGVCAVLGASFACGSRANGKVVVGVKDGPPTSSDGRTIASLQVDITRIELEAKDEGDERAADGGEDHHSADAGTADGGEAKDEHEEDVTVFEAGAAGPRTLDLLTVTSFSALMANTTVPAGTYQNARISISGARVVFSDASTVTVPLILEGDGKRSKAHYEFKFRPPVTVGASGTAVAVIDFVPTVQKDGSGNYHLGHDGEHDDSGERHETASLEVHGKVVSYDAVKKVLTLDTGAAIDVSAATIVLRGQTVLATAITAGLRAEVQNRLDATTGALVATRVELE